MTSLKSWGEVIPTFSRITLEPIKRTFRGSKIAFTSVINLTFKLNLLRRKEREYAIHIHKSNFANARKFSVWGLMCALLFRYRQTPRQVWKLLKRLERWKSCLARKLGYQVEKSGLSLNRYSTDWSQPNSPKSLEIFHLAQALELEKADRRRCCRRIMYSKLGLSPW